MDDRLPVLGAAVTDRPDVADRSASNQSDLFRSLLDRPRPDPRRVAVHPVLVRSALPVPAPLEKLATVPRQEPEAWHAAAGITHLVQAPRFQFPADEPIVQPLLLVSLRVGVPRD